MWNPATDPALAVNYDITNVLEHKTENKLALQQELGLVQDEGKFVIGLISRLTNQKGLDLVNAIVPQVHGRQHPGGGAGHRRQAV